MATQPLAEESTVRTTTATEAILALALIVLALSLVSGCRYPEVERTQRPLRVTVQTVPPGAEVTVLPPGGAEVRKLGRGPLEIEGLTIVRKRYPSQSVDYWLLDEVSVLPANPAKPWYASPEYSAGNDYPFDLIFRATSPGYEPVLASLLLDRGALKRLFEQQRGNTANVEVVLRLVPTPPAAPSLPPPARSPGSVERAP